MTIREEFEKAYRAYLSHYSGDPNSPTEREIALWAARWMAESCAVECEKEAQETFNIYEPIDCARRIRQLAKELEQ